MRGNAYRFSLYSPVKCFLTNEKTETWATLRGHRCDGQLMTN
jgi:hypothetical protein